MILQQVQIDLPSQSYPIYIGDTLFADSTLLKKHIVSQQVLLVTNETLAKLYLPQLKQALQPWQCDIMILPDGEQFKTLQTWASLLDHLANNKHHRDSTLIAFGGGVITDMAGFAAASYQRGIPLIQIPTSLLAQVDASIGGKTAVNHPVGKNLIGAFYQPQAVIIDISLLKTLPLRELKAGIAEIVKAALICDREFFCWLEQNFEKLLQVDQAALAKAIQRASEIKRDIVVKDEKENAQRALLNLGHTFGHAIEHCLSYGHWLHGEAVAAGLVLAAKLSEQHLQLSQQDTQRIITLLQNIGLPTSVPQQIPSSDLINAMQMDKKVQNKQMRFILLKSIGEAIVVENVDERDLLSILDK